MADNTLGTTWIYPPNWDGRSRADEDEAGGTFGNRKMIVRFTNLSGGTDESDAVKLAREDFYVWPGHPCRKIRIDKIEYRTFGMGVLIEWDMAPQQTIALLPENGEGCIVGPFYPSMGEDADYGPGETGNVLFTTIAAAANDTYDVTLHITLKNS